MTWSCDLAVVRPREVCVTRTRLTTAVVAATALGLAAAGCSYIRGHEAERTDRLLAAADFQMVPADTPAKLVQLKAQKPLKIIGRSKDGKMVYTYADPYNCQCMWVGGPDQYAKYQRIALEKKIADENLESAQVDEDAASMDWGPWGPWAPWW